MTQMVLPQTPAPGTQKDVGASKADAGRDNGAGESRYESVSRAEQKRLDRQQSARNDKPRNAGEAGAKDARKESGAQSVSQAESGKKSGEPGRGGNTSEAGEGKVPDDGTAVKSEETAAEMEATTTPLTFAQLQALLLPATGQAVVAGDTAGSAGNSSAAIQGSVLFPGLAGGNPGQGGKAVSSGSGGLVGLQITDALKSAVGEKAGSTDPSSLLSGARFESAMDLVSQQNTNSAGKLLAEAQVPLRSYATSVDVPVNHAEWGDKLIKPLLLFMQLTRLCGISWNCIRTGYETCWASRALHWPSLTSLTIHRTSPESRVQAMEKLRLLALEQRFLQQKSVKQTLMLAVLT